MPIPQDVSVTPWGRDPRRDTVAPLATAYEKPLAWLGFTPIGKISIQKLPVTPVYRQRVRLSTYWPSEKGAVLEEVDIVCPAVVTDSEFAACVGRTLCALRDKAQQLIEELNPIWPDLQIKAARSTEPAA